MGLFLSIKTLGVARGWIQGLHHTAYARVGSCNVLLGLLDARQLESVVVVALAKLPAATQAGCRSAKGAHPFDFRLAVGAAEYVGAWQLPARQGKIMASRLVGEAEFDAGFAPLGAVRCNAAASGTVACHKMRKFVQQGSFDFAPAERA